MGVWTSRRSPFGCVGDGVTWEMVAAKNGNAEGLGGLLAEYNGEPKRMVGLFAYDSSMHTALSLAAERGHVDVVRCILDGGGARTPPPGGANPDILHDYSLLFAARMLQYETFDMIASAHVNLNIVYRNIPVVIATNTRAYHVRDWTRGEESRGFLTALVWLYIDPPLVMPPKDLLVPPTCHARRLAFFERAVAMLLGRGALYSAECHRYVTTMINVAVIGSDIHARAQQVLAWFRAAEVVPVDARFVLSRTCDPVYADQFRD